MSDYTITVKDSRPAYYRRLLVHLDSDGFLIPRTGFTQVSVSLETAGDLDASED